MVHPKVKAHAAQKMARPIDKWCWEGAVVYCTVRCSGGAQFVYPDTILTNIEKASGYTSNVMGSISELGAGG